MSPELDLTIGGEEVICDNRNTRLQTYFGEIALYDNVVITQGQEDNSPAIIIFKSNDSYDKLKEVLLELGFPAYINLPEVSEHIVDAYLSQFNSDLGDTIPEGWE